MLAVLREADRTSVTYAARQHQASDATNYARRKHFGQIEANDVKRLKALELELELENSRIKEINAKKCVPPVVVIASQ